MISFKDYKYLAVSIERVFRASFNDTYYIETVYYEIDELLKKEEWIDPYNGRSRVGDTQVCLGGVYEDGFVIFERKNGSVAEKKFPLGWEHICAEDYDSSTLLSARIGLSRERRQY